MFTGHAVNKPNNKVSRKQAPHDATADGRTSTSTTRVAAEEKDGEAQRAPAGVDVRPCRASLGRVVDVQTRRASVDGIVPIPANLHA